MSANADLITVEKICTRGNNMKTSFSYMDQNVKKKYILGYLGGPEGVFNNQTRPILLSSYPLTHTCQIRKQSDKKFKPKI